MIGEISRRQLLSASSAVALTGCLDQVPFRHGEDRELQPTDPPTFDDRLTDGLRIAVISDVHWRHESRGEDIRDAEDLTQRIETFATDVNDFGADLVIQQGDLSDGCCGADERDYKDIREGITDAKATLEDAVDAEIVHLLGNHEYMWPSEGMGDIYSEYEWDGLADTYQIIERDGIWFALLNTGYTETDRDEDANDHMIPEQELSWLAETVDRVDGPLFVATHIPLTGGDGTKYDSLRGSEKCLDILHSSDHFLGGFFGHSHHASGWNRVRIQTDQRGHPHVHCPPPTRFAEGDDQFETDELIPYHKTIIDPEVGWQTIASYADYSVRENVTWRFNV